MKFNYQKCIFPILKYSKDHPELIGTGFFIDDKGTFLTAKHVFDNQPLSLRESYNIILLTDKPLKLYEVADIVKSKDYDIAKGIVRDISDITFAGFPDEEFFLNTDILTCEYSDSKYETSPDGIIKLLRLIDSVRKGNVIKIYYSSYPEVKETRCLELSFPAFVGASGAPVILENSWKVAGMIVANIERHLLPAHILKVQDGEKYIEEKSYFLPLGKAIHWQHLKDFALD